MWWRRKERIFEVLGERFVLPELRLGRHLERAARARRRLGATWLEALTDPLARPFRSPATRVQVAFLRAHRVLSAHEQVVYLALDHVAMYDDALARATRHVTEKAGAKIDTLLARAAERRRIAERAAHVASRVESQLERDLAVFADRVRAVGKAAHLMLVRLGRYRGFVAHTLSGLVQRESQLAAQRVLLVHDEHSWLIDRELASDRDFARWMTAPDALCAGIEESLRGLVHDLDGLESGLVAVPDAVERLLEAAELADPGHMEDPLAGLEDVRFEGLPAIGDVPVRLDDGDWDALEQHELESEVVFRATTVEALGIEVHDWLATRDGSRHERSRRCATCSNTIVSSAALGRAHVLCVTCRDRAQKEDGWLVRVGFRPIREGAGYVTDPITRVVFESVMGWVPSPGRSDDPVTDVTWHEAVAFCNALARREGRPEDYDIGSTRTAWRVRKDGPTGWRLPDRAPVSPSREVRGGLREWIWAGAEDARPTRKLGPGLRQIAGPTGMERATAEAREKDVGFRIINDRDVPVARPAVAATGGSRAREAKPRPVSHVMTRERPALSAATRRRRGQAAALTMLLVSAGVAIGFDRAGVFTRTTATASTPTPPQATRPATSPARPAAPVEPRPEPVEPVVAAPTGEAAEMEIVRGFSARASKDRKAARKFFEHALELAPAHLGARYEAAREAAFAKDTAVAFAHLDALVAAKAEPRARELLAQALIEPDFARMKRDARWKLVTAAAKP